MLGDVMAVCVQTLDNAVVGSYLARNDSGIGFGGVDGNRKRQLQPNYGNWGCKSSGKQLFF